MRADDSKRQQFFLRRSSQFAGALFICHSCSFLFTRLNDSKSGFNISRLQKAREFQNGQFCQTVVLSWPGQQSEWVNGTWWLARATQRVHTCAWRIQICIADTEKIRRDGAKVFAKMIYYEFHTMNFVETPLESVLAIGRVIIGRDL